MADSLDVLVEKNVLPNDPKVLSAIREDKTGTVFEKVKSRHAALMSQNLDLGKVSKDYLLEQSSKDIIPNDPQVFDAILSGKVTLDKVAMKHAEFKTKSPVVTLSSDGEVNKQADINKTAINKETFSVPKDSFISIVGPTGNIQYIPATKDEAEQVRKSETYLASSIVKGATFGAVDLNKITENDYVPSDEERKVSGAIEIASGLYTGGTIFNAIGKLPLISKLGSAVAKTTDKIGALKDAKKVLEATESVVTPAQELIKKQLFKLGFKKVAQETAKTTAESAVLGFGVGAAKQVLNEEDKSPYEIFKSAITESALYTAGALVLQPITSTAGALFGKPMKERASSSLAQLAKNKEVTQLAQSTARTDSYKQLSKEIVDKIDTLKPFVGLDKALLATPKALSDIVENKTRDLSNALFSESGPLKDLVSANKDLKLLIDTGKHAQALDAIQSNLTDVITNSSSAKEYIAAPFINNSKSLKKVYADRIMATVNNPGKYPNLEQNVFNYLNYPSSDNRILLTGKSAPKGFIDKVEKFSFADKRLNPQEVDKLTSSLIQESLDNISSAVSGDIPKQLFGKLEYTKDILNTAITFNKELSRKFITQFSENPLMFDENFVKANPELMDGVKAQINFNRLFKERTATIGKRSDLNAAITSLENEVRSGAADKALQLQALKDQRQTVTTILATQNKQLTSIKNTLSGYKPEQLDEIKTFVSKTFQPRRSGFTAEKALTIKAENRAPLLAKRRELKDALEQKQDTSTILNELSELRQKYRTSIGGAQESTQRYAERFGYKDDPYFVKDHSELADVMHAFNIGGVDIRPDITKPGKGFFFGNILNLRRALNTELGPNNVLSKVIDSIGEADVSIQKQIKHWGSRIEALGIKAGSQESAWVQRLAETPNLKTSTEFLSLPLKSQQKIESGKKFAREYYDTMLDSINEVMKSNNLPQIRKRDENFITHFNYEMDSLGDRIGSFLHGDSSRVEFDGKGKMFFRDTVNFDANRTEFYAEKARKGGEFIEDAITGMKGYLKPALERIYYSDIVRKLDTARTFAPENMGNLIQGIKTKYLLKSPNVIDQEISEGWKKALNVYRNRMGSGVISGNIGVALQQLLSVPLNAAVSPIHFGKALITRGTKESREVLSLSKNLAVRDAYHLEVDPAASFKKIFSPALKSAKDTWEKYASFAMQTFDKEAASNAFLTGYYKAKSTGASKLEAIKFGDLYTEMIQNNPTRAGQPELYQNVVARAFTQFTSFTVNYGATILNDLPNIARTEGGAKSVSMIMRSVAGMSIANEVAEASGLPRPFDIYTFIPFIGTYRFGVSGLPTVPFEVVSAMSGDRQESSKAKRKLTQKAAALALPAGGQIFKTAEAAYETRNQEMSPQKIKKLIFGKTITNREKKERQEKKASVFEQSRGFIKKSIFNEQ